MTAPSMTAASRFTLLPLKPFQNRDREALARIIADTASKIEADPARRRDVALAQGVTLLRAPTGSGKTLTMGRALEGLIGTLPRRTCWFWFAPYSGLVAQTRDALKAQCPTLRLRDLQTDRVPETTRDGDVFVATWASVASATKEGKRARRESETLPSVDRLIVALRADGWTIGAVIDEAHVNFGTSAKQAAGFYLDVLQPDFTILATATPKDDELERFERLAGITRVNRVEVSREEAVRAGLNKVGVKAVHFRPDPKDANLLDMGEVAVFFGLARHNAIKKSLAEAGIDLTPLMLIQVENAAKGEPDPADRMRDFLKAQGVSADTIAVHTSGEPDPMFHALAYDEEKEILIFKVAAATGFDAPRAWTLVSLRTSTGPEFGRQILGRIMRVHGRIQHLHPWTSTPPGEAGPLDYGYVFLANPAAQLGIASAASEITALHDGIATVTDTVAVIQVSGGRAVLVNPQDGFAEMLELSPAVASVADAVEGAASGGSSLERADADEPAAPLRSAALRIQRYFDLGDTLVRRPRPDGMPAGDFTLTAPEVAARRTPPGQTVYPLRTDLDFPRFLAREVMPRTMEGLVAGIADRVKIDAEVIAMVNRTRGKVTVTEEDVFGIDRTSRRETVPLSGWRIGQQAQMSFRFNDAIDERDLKPALIARLRRELEERGHDVPEERDLRRAVDLLALARPDLLHDACRACLAQVVEVRQDEPIPERYAGPDLLERAAKNVYGVFPASMNEEELAFARLLDEDGAGTVRWWLRNESGTRWAVSIILPTGRRHYPDFVVGVDARRRSEDSIALVEVKDDGRTGRLFSMTNTDKVRTEHSRYRSALMVFRDERGEWFNVVYRPDIRRHHVGGRFTIEDLVWTN
ncbi:DEAD/DEAH box helicase [Azospirillum brasilense]|uniref:DEAD/DEAH box helicase n=1 Tax=Azospirillum brasilense TaxID=192 RepID=UPI001EDA694C|nr:DEAD/DEAH box helicase family protein [Azospirillum brasilense]UKJ75926.1 DEAD/DEAH box helicase family protein [Azospirillum brasilense]